MRLVGLRQVRSGCRLPSMLSQRTDLLRLLQSGFRANLWLVAGKYIRWHRNFQQAG